MNTMTNKTFFTLESLKRKTPSVSQVIPGTFTLVFSGCHWVCRLHFFLQIRSEGALFKDILFDCVFSELAAY